MSRIALSLLFTFASCATTSRLTSQGGDRLSASDVGPICETQACGGTADPIEIGIGLAIVVGIAFAGWLKSR